ncbi:hypothetical protein GIB67_019299 [Kingdonia uniflora]|uniref:RNase H type-1 domain-containing protein n=1 Tax=Kingdonia uniflora TaxID=39325 RepID=A0A7J7L1B0_9MAGN|nr:hypothetical protein GIB67_019299 [Kingdonia uniflora]
MVSNLLMSSGWNPNQNASHLLAQAGVNLADIFVNHAGTVKCIYKSDFEGKLLNRVASSFSSYVENIWVNGVLACINAIWMCRNKIAHDECAPTISPSNPGKAGSGAVFRVYTGEVIDVLTKNIGVQISYCAECNNILSSLFSIHEHGWTKIYLVSDSQTAIKAFQHNNVLGNSKPHGVHFISNADKIQARTPGGSVTLSADDSANRAARLHLLTKEWFDGRPSFLKKTGSPLYGKWLAASSDDQKWLIHSGATYGATPHTEFFMTYTMGNFGIVNMGNKSVVKCKYCRYCRIGDVHRQVDSGSNLLLKDE